MSPIVHSRSLDDDCLSDERLVKLLRRLSDLSMDRSYNPRQVLHWPATLPANALWMSVDLLSLNGSPHINDLTRDTLYSLSRWELINFFSFNVHGLRDLLVQIIGLIHRHEFSRVSEYFHHFIDEENKHMWFFAEFCNRYGHKIYPDMNVRPPSGNGAIEHLMTFAKILITENIGDFYNIRMANDGDLPEIVRQINRLHHDDEARHLAMGTGVIDTLCQSFIENSSQEAKEFITGRLANYMQYCIQSLYNVRAYRDAGLMDPHALRRQLLCEPARVEFHKRVLDRSFRFFESHGLRVERSFLRSPHAKL